MPQLYRNFPHYPIGPFVHQPHADVPFALTRFEQMAEPEVEDPHTHAFYEILWVEQGHSMQAIDGRRYQLGPGSLFFISPGQLHAFEWWQHLRGGTLMFTEAFFLSGRRDTNLLLGLSYLDNPSTEPLFVPGTADWQRLLLLLQALEAETAPALQRAYLEVILLLIERARPGAAYATPQLIAYKRFRSLLEQHFTAEVGTTYYADQLGLSTQHLSRCCVAVSGQPTRWHIEQRRLTEARRLLAYTTLTISEIAFQLAYHDTSHFAKAFRKHLGIAPLAYRAQFAATHPQPHS
ncbi:MAG: helix-turn-helix transcriptional regulator [Bacteroidetes bacterium]|jgi:AraC family transcriptional activator of pobA|nr:helix-turn-helix transcriptional regulator [Bacteroidota bacterium]